MDRDEDEPPPRVVATQVASASDGPAHSESAHAAQPQVVYGEPVPAGEPAPSARAPTAAAGASKPPAESVGQKAGTFAKVAAAKAAEAAQRAAEASARASQSAATKLQEYRAEQEAKSAAGAKANAGPEAGAQAALPLASAAPPPAYAAADPSPSHPIAASTGVERAEPAPQAAAGAYDDVPLGQAAKPQPTSKVGSMFDSMRSSSRSKPAPQPSAAEGQPVEQQAAAPSAGVYRDAAWAIVWLVGMFCVLGILSGYASALPSDSDSASAPSGSASNSTDTAESAGASSGGRVLNIGAFVGTLCACLVASALFAAAYLEVIFKKSEQLVTLTLYGSLVASLTIMLVAFVVAGAVGVLFLFLFLLNCWYVYCVRPFIPLAAAQLTVAVTALKEFPQTKLLAYPAMLVEASWALLWLWTYSVIVQAGASGVVHIFLLLMLFWTSQVVKNVVHVTTAGAVGAWYFQGEAAPRNSVGLALQRAVTFSFGSICLGSLLVALIKTIRALVSQARGQAAGGFADCALCCVDCLLGCLDQLMQYFNHYAYTRVALYGVSFVTVRCHAACPRGLPPSGATQILRASNSSKPDSLPRSQLSAPPLSPPAAARRLCLRLRLVALAQAAKEVWGMIAAKGLEALIRDDLIGNVLFFGCLIGGVISAIIASLVAAATSSTGVAIIMAAILGFVVGFMVTQQTTEIVQSATAAIFVSYGSCSGRTRGAQGAPMDAAC